MSNEVIVLITKDRPFTLEKTLDQLGNMGTNTIIIDDSTTDVTYEFVSNRYKRRNITYHGRGEQNALLLKYKNLKLKNFIKPLGTKDWNLGFVRNYALVVAKSLGYEKVLFMDDDIIVRQPECVDQIFVKASSYDFVGARITGMADDSAVGHVMRACDGEFFEFLSGGFLAFNINKVSEYFLNYYNEDQIWLFLHPPGTRFESYCEVVQQQYNPFENALMKALKQEYGEILEEGAEEAFGCGDHYLLLKNDFWKEICDTRLDYLNRLPGLLAHKEINYIGLSIYQALTDYHSRISHASFVNVFQQYFENRELWNTTLGSI